MVRADVAVAPVSWTLVPGTRTAFIRLDQFSSGAADDLEGGPRATSAKAGADRLILDLRGNPGGYVNEADRASPASSSRAGVVFIERDADGNETTHPVTPGGLATDLPLVVLVDGGTASSVGDRLGRPPGRRSRPDRRGQDVRDRHGPRRVPAVGRFRAAGRHGRVADPQGPPDLARGDHPGRRGRACQRCRPGGPGSRRQDDTGPGRQARPTRSSPAGSRSSRPSPRPAADPQSASERQRQVISATSGLAGPHDRRIDVQRIGR